MIQQTEGKKSSKQTTAISFCSVCALAGAEPKREANEKEI